LNSRSLERGEVQSRDRDLEQRFRLRLGQALDAFRRHEIDQQRDSGFRDPLVSL
jgi:hypothetical protein